MANDFQLQTKKGHDFFEASSAFQKAVRRCDERQAMYWGIEMYESGKHKYVWKRMIIMASEDVGLGEPSCIVQMMALKQSFDYLFEQKDRGRPERLPFAHAILCLVRSRKSRYIDHAITAYWQEHDKHTLEVPDYALDSHTRRGKAKGRTLDFFYTEASKIYNANKPRGEEELEARARQIDKTSTTPRKDIDCDVDPDFSVTNKVVENPTLF